MDRAAPSGTRLITSTPPATTTSCAPEITWATAKSTACWLDPQARLTVVPGMDSGQPAASTANRPMLDDWSPTWPTQPQITSSTTAGSMPVRCASARSTSADRSAACAVDSPPPRLPTAVLTASTTTASRAISTNPYAYPENTVLAGPRASGGLVCADGELPGFERYDVLAAVPTGRLEDEREGRQMLYSCLRSVDSAGELAGEPNGKLYKRRLRERYWAGHASLII